MIISVVAVLDTIKLTKLPCRCSRTLACGYGAPHLAGHRSVRAAFQSRPSAPLKLPERNGFPSQRPVKMTAIPSADLLHDPEQSCGRTSAGRGRPVSRSPRKQPSSCCWSSSDSLPALIAIMQVTVASTGDLMFTIDVANDIELENFKALCEAESGIASSQIRLSLNGQELTDDQKSLSAYGVADGDVLAIHSPTSAAAQPGLPDFGSVQLPAANQRRPEDDPAVIRNMILSNPEQLSQLRQTNPALADAAVEGLDQFAKVFQDLRNQRSKADEMRIRMLMANPFDTEAQRLIAEEIKRQNIEANMETAMEYHPESYGQVTMLYITCKVNGHPVKAFVDSGAQSTIMSNACAERCNIVRLIDTRWSGIAKGVGTQRIIGRIHLCQVQIEKDFLASSFTILQDQPMDMLLGLDMLRRHQCSIDLKRNTLLIGTTGTETRFLDENEIESLRMKSDDGSEDGQLAQAINQSLKEKPGSSSSGQPAESAIQEILKCGYSRDQAVEELNNFAGDVQKALAALVAKSLKFPK